MARWTFSVQPSCTPKAGPRARSLPIERQAIRRRVFPSVRDLMIKIRAFINGRNSRKHPFIWTKTPEHVLAEIKRKQTSSAHH